MNRAIASVVFVFSIALVASSSSCCGRRLLYQRTDLDAAGRAALAEKPGWDSATLSIDDVDLQGVVSRPQSATAPWILYYGGNATPLDASVEILIRLRGDADIGLAAFAYRGYDGSEGRPTQRRLTSDGVAAARKIAELAGGPARVVLVGQSLGTGVATQVTARLQQVDRAPAALVLVSPFVDIPAVAHDAVGCAPVCLFPDPWRTLRRAPAIRVPALVLHGTKDTVIPHEHGERVAAAIPGARFVPVEGRDHNDIWTEDAAETVRRFVLEVAR